MNQHRPPFDAVTMCLHWLTLALIAALFTSAWARQNSEDARSAGALLELHRSLGVSVWIVSVSRLVWRHTGAYLPPFPAHMGRTQRAIAKTSEYVLYALLVAQPLTGLAQTVLRGRGFEIFLIHVGPIVARNSELAHSFHDLHEAGGAILLGVIGLHASAALAHHFLWRDGVLVSMLPGRRRHCEVKHR
jgi:superoxide oxidase